MPETPLSCQPLSQWELAPASYYLVVCRLEPENHVLEILRAFQQSRSNRELILVGNHLADSEYVSKLKSVRDSRIRMIGTVYNQAQLTSLRYHSFAYMHGHSVGGTNPSLLEAMGCGNLIFAHDNPFNRETLGPSGLYFNDIPGLIEAIDRVERGDVELKQLREGSRLRACLEYRWEDIISRYVSLLEQVVRLRSARRR